MPAPILPMIPTMADGRPAPGWGGNRGYGQPTIWPQQQQIPQGYGQTTPWQPAHPPQQPMDQYQQAALASHQGTSGLGAAMAAPRPGWGLLLGAIVAGGLVWATTSAWR